MKVKLNMKSILLMIMIIALCSTLFINISLATNTGKIGSETARIRREANTNSDVLAIAEANVSIEILDETDGWYKIKYNDLTGYVRKDLVIVDKATESVNNVENTTENSNNTENVVNDSKITENTISTQNNDSSNESNTTGKDTIKLGKYFVTKDVKLKVIPLISAIELGDITKDTEVEVTEILNSWVKIKTTDGKQGWIIYKIVNGENTEYTLSSTKEEKTNSEQNEQTTNASTATSRSGLLQRKSTSSTTKTTTSTKKTTSTTTSTNNKQTTKTTNTASTVNTTNKTTSATASSTQSGNGNSVVAYAKQFLGYKYVYGGSSPAGFDCSGFTQYVYKHFGVSLNRTAAGQYQNGTKVTSLQAGDLVMFGKSGISHVGIYVGGNSFIHAANRSQGVRIDSLSTGYYKTNYVGAKRVK